MSNMEAFKNVTAQIQKELAEDAIKTLKEALAEREQDGQCKHCTDGCPACDARKLPKEAHDLF